MFGWLNASMDESYAIAAGPETSEILVDFQMMLSAQPVLILTRSNCYYTMQPKLTSEDWIFPDMNWKQYVYFCEENNNTGQPVFLYRYSEVPYSVL